MPGAGGGGNGGGFGGGSFGGGHGGGFGGGHRGPRGPRFGFFPGFGFFGPRFGYGGGCLGGLLGLILLPLIVIVLVFSLLFLNVASAVSNVANGGIISYDEKVFQQYADKQYRAEFGSNQSAYEDNILIVFLTNEEYDGYYAIAWVGDNIHPRINQMFGNESTAFGRAMKNSINQTYYENSLSGNLSLMMYEMTDNIKGLNLSSSFSVPPANTTVKSHLTNKSSLAISADTVNSSLESFTEETGITAVIVVDTMENVFGKNIPISDIIFLVLMVAVIVVMIIWIVKIVKKNKNNRGSGGNNNGYNNGYNNSYNNGYNNYNGGYNNYGRYR